MSRKTLEVNAHGKPTANLASSGLRGDLVGGSVQILKPQWSYDEQPKRVVRSCNLCGSQSFSTIASIDRYGYSATSQVCLRCALVFLNPVMTQAAYELFYQGVYRPLVSFYHQRRIDARTIQSEQANYAVSLKVILEPFVQKGEGRTLLDVGGSTGVVAHQIAEAFGLRAIVMDPSIKELREARELGLETRLGMLEEYDPRGERYGIVTVCQTIDHFLDIFGGLRKINSMLEEEGLLYLDIVDFKRAVQAAGSIEGAIKVDHPYYLTESSAEGFLARTGFRVVWKRASTDSLHVNFVCVKDVPDPDYLPSENSIDWLRRIISSRDKAAG